ATSAAGRVWVIGGYDGSSLATDVLTTRDGRSFSTAARLPVPVRYPAVTTVGGTIYVFGGETTAGHPTNAIQSIDAVTGRARVIGHLHQALAHASAVAIGSRVYILGGTSRSGPTAAIVAFDPRRGSVTRAGQLPAPVTNAAAAVIGGNGYLVGGIGSSGAAVRSVIALQPRRVHATAHPQRPAPTPAAEASSSARAPFRGRLLIADRGNNRLLVVNAAKRVLWRYPGGRPQPKGRFYFPDDAFFIHGGHGIISNEEENEAIVEIAYPSGRVLHSYGHPGVIGSSPGFFHEPDDAYLLRDGTVTVADAQNCRIVFLAPGGRTSQIGTTGDCTHDPPRSLAAPNGDTPLANGDVLVSEVQGSYVDELTRGGHLVWTTHVPIAYPSDPQRLGRDRYLVADYTRPGGVYEFNRAGRILWSYHPAGGPGMLDHPSLAEQFPGGLIAVTDDYRDRVVLIDRRTKRIVWQYGQTANPGTATGSLNTPDGFDLLAPSGRMPTHPYTG
ncbi:MAG TPA: PQQ-binding-like beta-propeller repeat protein, partial [Acidimicrobiia bacterium]|nr:PQQ-binding-like beta-propeller repeat protein [Acidimicrobiia bacterium]